MIKLKMEVTHFLKILPKIKNNFAKIKLVLTT